MLFSGNDWWFYDATVGKIANGWFIAPAAFILMALIIIKIIGIPNASML